MKVVISGNPGEKILSEWRADFPSIDLVAAGSVDEQVAAVRGAEVWMGYGMDRQVFLAGQDTLKWVHATSAGVERIVNIPELVESNVQLTNTRGGHAACIAEHTFAMLLLLTRRLLPAYADQQAHEWDRGGVSGGSVELTGSTMVILGMGNIGRQIAKRAVAFEMRVIGVDMNPGAAPAGVEAIWPLDRLDEAMKLADVFVVTLPITPQTYHMIDGRRLALLDPQDYLIVVSRGGIVDEAPLIAALKEGKLAGAGLDVQEHEPMPAEDPLWDAPNLILTPHCSAASRQTMERVMGITKENLRRYLAGQPLENLCDKRAGF
ncbi:MAG: D-2-hydroxyacid dehydrogenase [Chloroflexi bacterium]|nr:D-2-hydroxyacid dehydrogenase [Chloroflexota bacterium]